MALSVVKSTAKISAADVNTSAGSFGSLPAAGNLIVVQISGWHDVTAFAVSSVTDNQGNTYTKADSQTGGGAGSNEASIWYAKNIGAPSGTFTITVHPSASSGNYIDWIATEVAGADTSSPLDKVAHAAGSTTGDAAAGPTATLAQADEIVFAVCSVSNNDATLNLTTPSGYTAIAVNQDATATIGFQSSYKIVAATTAVSAAWSHDNTSQSGWGATIATFKQAAGGVSLTATGITTSPAVGTPAITQAHGLTATGIAPTAPATGSPALGQVHVLGATGITTSPAVGTPAITQLHALGAVGIAAGAPPVGSPAISQVHVLAASGVTASPVLGLPALSVTGALSALGITASPAVGSPGLGQVHVLTASGIAAGAPGTGSPALTQSYPLTASGIALGAPGVGGPALGQVHVLTAAQIALGAPGVGGPAVGQAHSLAATGLATAAPSVGAPAIGNGYSLTATGISASPVVGSPAMGGAHALVASGLATPAPGVGSPPLTQGQALLALGITLAPAVGRPALDLILSISVDRQVALAAYPRLVVVDAPPPREISLEAAVRSILAPPNRE